MRRVIWMCRGVGVHRASLAFLPPLSIPPSSPALLVLPDRSHYSTWIPPPPSQTASVAERAGGWHHLAVTWSTANHGLTRIYVDGLLSEWRGRRGGLSKQAWQFIAYHIVPDNQTCVARQLLLDRRAVREEGTARVGAYQDPPSSGQFHSTELAGKGRHLAMQDPVGVYAAYYVTHSDVCPDLDLIRRIRLYIRIPVLHPSCAECVPGLQPVH